MVIKVEKEKYKMYSLYANLSYEDIYKYTPEEMAKSVEKDGKRGLLLMSGEKIEYLDNMTANYDSMDDLLNSYVEEVYGEKKPLFNPMIIVDKDPKDRNKSYIIPDIVFKEDKIEIEKKDNLKEWVTDYLRKNNNDIRYFRGINQIYKNISEKHPNEKIEKLIEMTMFEYFVVSNYNYKRRREAYFTVKSLDQERVKSNGIHR